MLVLSVESSAVTASAALAEDDEILKCEFINKGLTHSETLLPLVEKVMEGRKYSELDAIAVSVGPGSFTGVRIGVAAVKGLAFTNDTPCISVSSLEAIAYNFTDENGIICAVMDARRMQFYNALFEVKNGKVNRLTPDRAISLEDLQKELEQYDRVIAAGDGAFLLCEKTTLQNIELAPENKVYQSAAGVCLAAQNKNTVSASALMPVYLRQSQAERELKLKKSSKKEN